jgi:predicted nucleic acid-binding protein
MAEPGITFDTGALIALERGDKRMRSIVLGAMLRKVRLTVPAVVLAEWWRATPRQKDILDSIDVEDTTRQLGQSAGAAQVSAPATAVDAIVMASAAQRGDLVYTSDFEDLQALRDHFRAVAAVLRV